MQIRVDTGGTFTDACCYDAQGKESRVKVLSSGHLRFAIMGRDAQGLRVKIREEGLPESAQLVGFLVTGGGEVLSQREGWLELSEPLGEAQADVIELSTGEEAPVLAVRLLSGVAMGEAFPKMDLRVATTRGTNALLEGKGARLALWTNEGLEDLLEIRDQRRADLFDHTEPPREILAEKVYSVRARLDAEGNEIVPLEEQQVREQAREARTAGIEVAAVALLHSYQNGEHEQRIATLLREEGFEIVRSSSEIAASLKLLPRMETAAADAWLSPVMEHFVERLRAPLGGQEPWLMTSAGSLESVENFHPKDSLLSGPAGGMVGAGAVARSAGFESVLTFDMGGTSTDVARLSADVSYRYEQEIGSAYVLGASLPIETVAAGGSSICQWRRGALEVGPESAGAFPGPACYGRGGPFTLTDVNLLLGYMDATKAAIPLSVSAAQAAYQDLRECMQRDVKELPNDQDLLGGLRQIAIERMADAIRTVSVREGFDPAEHALLAFGGAGPQHACELAECLGVEQVLVPADCGLLSAYGLHCAKREYRETKTILKLLDKCTDHWEVWWRELEQCARSVSDLGEIEAQELSVRHLVELRLRGQETAMELVYSECLEDDFLDKYEDIYGYRLKHAQLEVVSLRLILREAELDSEKEIFPAEWAEEVAHEIRGSDQTGSDQIGSNNFRPHLIQDVYSTCVLAPGWSMKRGSRGTMLLQYNSREKEENRAQHLVRNSANDVEVELYRGRFEAVVSHMGEQLRRTAISTNIKERLDYSCALLNAAGELIVNAPHIPVHLGALGVCVRRVIEYFQSKDGEEIEQGDMIVVNHPGYGGSHLPDITVISPVFVFSEIVAWVANRAHHAEVGGLSPGSMPAAAKNLAQEGVVIPPCYLFRRGKECFDSIRELFASSEYPSRNVEDNLADLRAQAAANVLGVKQFQALCESKEGTVRVSQHMSELMDRAQRLASLRIQQVGEFCLSGQTELDCGAQIRVSIESDGQRLHFDFTGSSVEQKSNLNATEAIVRSVVLYVIRLWVDDSLPLNEGLLRNVTLHLPSSFLNPDFSIRPEECPAVVGGNVEVSQQLVDLLVSLLGIQAQSQGTMNNLLFGNEAFGYYETIAGGAGASSHKPGTSARQVHMTNTAMTDPELMEWRYPVRVLQFSQRAGSGGEGQQRGGDGVIRELEFLESMEVSMLSNRRKNGAKGLAGGGEGKAGKQCLIRGEQTTRLPTRFSQQVQKGDRIRIETPGGGGYGKKPPS